MFTRAELDADKLRSEFACPVDHVGALTTGALMLPPLLTSHNVHIVDLTRVVLAKSNHISRLWPLFTSRIPHQDPFAHWSQGLIGKPQHSDINISAKVERDPGRSAGLMIIAGGCLSQCF